jgi:hypothetical protein
MNEPELSAKKVLSHLLVGNQIQQAIYVVTKLGIADLVKDGPKRSEELAQITGAHPDALYRLLRALASFGIFAEDEQCRFELTPLASLLQKGAFNPLTAFTPAVTAYDFKGVNTVIDVGGGRGDLLAAILRAHPAMHGILVEHPRVLKSAKSVLASAGVADRCEILSRNILESVPHGDVYILKSVIHGLNDNDAIRLLTNCHRVMNNSGKLLLVEFLMPAGNHPFPGKLMDLLMLVGCYGRERSEDEFRSLCSAARFSLVNIVMTKSPYSIMEAVAI